MIFIIIQSFMFLLIVMVMIFLTFLDIYNEDDTIFGLVLMYLIMIY